MSITPEALKAFVNLANAVVDAVKEAGPMGAPAGPLYVAFMTYGVSLDQFERLMSMLVNAGRLRKSGNLYYVKEKPKTAG